MAVKEQTETAKFFSPFVGFSTTLRWDTMAVFNGVPVSVKPTGRMIAQFEEGPGGGYFETQDPEEIAVLRDRCRKPGTNGPGDRGGTNWQDFEEITTSARTLPSAPRPKRVG